MLLKVFYLHLFCAYLYAYWLNVAKEKNVVENQTKILINKLIIILNKLGSLNNKNLEDNK